MIGRKWSRETGNNKIAFYLCIGRYICMCMTVKLSISVCTCVNLYSFICKYKCETYTHASQYAFFYLFMKCTKVVSSNIFEDFIRMFTYLCLLLSIMFIQIMWIICNLHNFFSCSSE